MREESPHSAEVVLCLTGDTSDQIFHPQGGANAEHSEEKTCQGLSGLKVTSAEVVWYNRGEVS